MIKNIFQLLRPKHYLKNLLIFLPIVFSGELTNQSVLTKALLSFIAFSFVASSVYIINDIRDRRQDRLHKKKRNRPIASGSVTVPMASIILGVLLIAAIGIQLYIGAGTLSSLLLLLYLVMNVAYSLGLKDIPILDVLILSLGFVIRVFYGAEVVDIDVSKWLYLAVLAFSFFLGLGKRRNELSSMGVSTRKVNRHYTREFLDKNMYVSLGLTVVYYSLWATDPTQKHPAMAFTVPFIIAIVMGYSLAVENKESDGDPVDVLLGSKPLITSVLLYGLIVIGIAYL